MSRIVVSNQERMPVQDHFAILRYRRITIPGDERSRTHPGHGYPESVEAVVEYDAYFVRAEWEAEVARLTRDRLTPFSALVVTVPSITTRVEVTP